MKKGYIKGNTYLIMNLKERGITVGDLLIIFIFILTTAILVKSFKNDKKTTFNPSYQEQIYNNNFQLSNINLKNMTS